MAFAFDTLGYAKKLRSAGVPRDQAEAHAEAAREFVMAELVTRHDLEVARNDLEGRIDALRKDLERRIDAVDDAIDRVSLRLTVRMGVMLAAAIAVLATIIRLS
jgi:hypothetical protein